MAVYFAHGHIRTVLYVMGQLFSQIHVAKHSSSGEIKSFQRVPIRCAPSSRSHVQPDREEIAEDLARFYEMFPRISYEFVGLTYAQNRQHSQNHRRKNPRAPNQDWYSPAPYNLDFEMTIAARNQLQAVEIVEQILPWYRPNLNVAIRHEGFVEQENDLVITLNSVTPDDNYDERGTTRVVTYKLSFTVAMEFWGPIPGTTSTIDVLEDETPGGPSTPVTPPSATAKPITKIIVDYLHSDVLSSDDIHFPVIEREILTPDPSTATSQEEMTRVDVEVDTDVQPSERRPTPI